MRGGMALKLQRAKIIGVTKSISQLLEDAPKTLRPFTADFLFQRMSEVRCNAIVHLNVNTIGEDAVEAAWAVVDPVLKTHLHVRPYKRLSWGPKEADVLIATDGGWYKPGRSETTS